MTWPSLQAARTPPPSTTLSPAAGAVRAAPRRIDAPWGLVRGKGELRGAEAGWMYNTPQRQGAVSGWPLGPDGKRRGRHYGGAERSRLGAPVNQWSQQKPVLHKTRQRACACASGRDEVRGLGRRRGHCTGCTARADMCRRRGEWAGTVVPRLAKLY